jgi:hypothetical protein
MTNNPSGHSSSTGSPTDTSSGLRRHSSSSRDRDRRSYDEYGPKELRKLLRRTTAQLEAETFRASEAERELQTLTVHLKRINDARLAALQDAAKAKEELKLATIHVFQRPRTKVHPQTIHYPVQCGAGRDISRPRSFTNC